MIIYGKIIKHASNSGVSDMYLYIFAKSPRGQVNVYNIISMEPLHRDADHVQIKYRNIRANHNFASTNYTIASATEREIFNRNGMPLMWMEERDDIYAATKLREWRLDQIERREKHLSRLLGNYAEEKERLREDNIDEWVVDRVIEGK